MSKNILFITATHGDEPIGILALKKLEQTYPHLNWIIGNEQAFLKRTRYSEKDLNRSAPGDLNSSVYESQRSAEILAYAKNYDSTIDIHGAKENIGICIILTNPTIENFRVASLLDISRIVIWPSCTPEMKYPMSEFFPCGFEIECGPKDDIETVNRLVDILATFLQTKQLAESPDTDAWKKRLAKKELFVMTGSIKINDVPEGTALQEFTDAQLADGSTAVPVFIGTYDYGNIVAYKLVRLTVDDIIH